MGRQRVLELDRGVGAEADGYCVVVNHLMGDNEKPKQEEEKETTVTAGD